MNTDQYISEAVSEFQKVIEHLKFEYGRVQAGRASVNLLDGIQVESYGTMQPIKALANITVTDVRTIQIQPWDKSMLGPIEKAISTSDLNLNPVNDGVLLRISIPALTEERRRELTKLVHKLAEDARISVRNIRQKAHGRIKDLKGQGEITEDDMHGADKKLQDKVDDVNKQIEDVAKIKENDIMTI